MRLRAKSPVPRSGESVGPAIWNCSGLLVGVLPKDAILLHEFQDGNLDAVNGLIVGAVKGEVCKFRSCAILDRREALTYGYGVGGEFHHVTPAPSLA